MPRRLSQFQGIADSGRAHDEVHVDLVVRKYDPAVVGTVENAAVNRLRAAMPEDR